jgi:type I restriction enzyme S subunit
MNKLCPLDKAIRQAKREIELIGEYRTRLIADLVTGKLDVRGVEVPEMQDEALVDEALEEMENTPDIEEAA